MSASFSPWDKIQDISRGLRRTRLISCKHLTRRFGDFVAVDDITFEVPKGSIQALLGPNGAGKSTTLKMLCGLLPPSSGQAAVCGHEVISGELGLKRNIGVLPEGLGLFDDLTIEEHLLLTGSVYGVSREETFERTEKLLGALDLNHGRRKFARACSFGMRKKTALAMALLPDPPVLLLDEPFETVDPVAAIAIRELLAERAERGTTILISSHMLSVVERVAAHFMIMRAGKIVWQSPASAMTASLEKVYLQQVLTEG
jgi:ABC-2 type transport system ATP-binding protein